MDLLGHDERNHVLIIWVLTGFLFWVWMKLGKSMGSLRKKMIVWSCLETFSPDEEDGGVVAHNVPVALLRVELHCKPTRVPGREDAVVTLKNIKFFREMFSVLFIMTMMFCDLYFWQCSLFSVISHQFSVICSLRSFQHLFCVIFSVRSFLAPGCVGGPALSTNSGKPDGNRSLLPNLLIGIRNRTSSFDQENQSV